MQLQSSLTSNDIFSNNFFSDFLGPLFEVLYDEEIISEGTVATWETSGEELLGKGSALNSVKGFLEWLKSADDESHDVNKR